MKSKRPKGITVLSIFLLISSLLAIKHILNPDEKLIMANHIITGATVNVYYAITIGVGISVAIGLWRLKKWAALLFLFQNTVFALITTVNMILIQKETLLLAGWKDYDRLLHGYRAYQVVALVFLFLFMIWILAYRRYFATQTLTKAEPIN